ncbi:hypothetical protein EZS27_010504 [termite gut metagenome]|uniref:Uncharacterized protein n=1 Tax=termite gut metagenome TaxID=433724 RepID=A0A5J4S8J6_9ZZZZ
MLVRGVGYSQYIPNTRSQYSRDIIRTGKSPLYNYSHKSYYETLEVYELDVCEKYKIRNIDYYAYERQSGEMVAHV